MTLTYIIKRFSLGGAMKNIRNIYCIGRNFVEHVKELNNKILTEPLVFTKPTHSLVIASNEEINLPSNQGDVHYEVELVVQMQADYEAGKSVNQLIGQLFIGLDLTLRDVQEQLKNAGHPWLKAKGFKNSAIISDPISFPGDEQLKELPFSLRVNGQTVQQGKAEQMIFDINSQIKYIAEHFGLKKGDLIFTGTPAGVNKLHDKDYLSLVFNGKEVGSCMIRLI